MERRELLCLLAYRLGGGFLRPGLLRRIRSVQPSLPVDDALPLEAVVSITDHYRLVLDSYPAKDLLAPVLGHLQLVSQLLDSNPWKGHRRSSRRLPARRLGS